MEVEEENVLEREVEGGRKGGRERERERGREGEGEGEELVGRGEEESHTHTHTNTHTNAQTQTNTRADLPQADVLGVDGDGHVVRVGALRRVLALVELLAKQRVERGRLTCPALPNEHELGPSKHLLAVAARHFLHRSNKALFLCHGLLTRVKATYA